MPYDVDSPPQVASKYSSKCQRAFVHAFNSVHADTKDDGKAMAAGHAAARRCEGKQSAMNDVRFNIVTGLLKAMPETGDGVKRLMTTASSTVDDLADDNLELSALQQFATAAQDNMTIFLNHKYQVPEDVLGSVEIASIMAKGGDVYDLDFRIRVDESNERAVKTWNQIKNGTKLGTSIGARIPEGGYERKESGGLRIKNILPLEASIVGIPANPRSFVQYAIKALHDAEADEEEVTTTVTTTATSGSFNINLGEEIVVGEAGPETITVLSGVDGNTVLNEAEPPDAATEAEEAPKHDTNPQTTVESDENLDTTTTSESQSTVTVDPSDEGDSAGSDTPSQEADKSVPESDGIDDEDTRAVITKGIETLESLLHAANDELVESRKALSSETEARVKAERELHEAHEDLKLARDIVERINALPIGRRTSFAAASTEFRDRFSGLYGDEVIKLLERDSNGG